MDYKVDLRDIKFQLFEWLGLGEMLEALDTDRHFEEMDRHAG